MGRGRNRYDRDWDEQEEYDDEYDDDEYEYERRPRKRPQRRRRRRRRVWPFVLAGCGLGVLLVVCAAAGIVFFTLHSLQDNTGGVIGLNHPQTFTQQNTQKVALSTLTQMQICDSTGNVKVQVDPHANAITVASQKIVHMNSQAAAEQEFGRISVVVQTPGTISTQLMCAASQSPSAATPSTGASSAQGVLMVNARIPDSGGFMRGSSDSVDLRVTLPPGVLPGSGPTLGLDVDAPIGNISVDGVSGVLNIKGSTGSIDMSRLVLANGSHIETGQGNVIFNGLLAAPTAVQTQASYIMQCEQGNIDVTLPANTNVVLDANTNVGAIKSDFAIDVQNNSDGSKSFHGPLTSSTDAQSAPVLVLDVSTGNVNLHRAQL